MNRKMLPILFMLISGTITCIATFIHKYAVLEKLIILFIVMVVFGMLGSILQHTLDYFDKQNAKAQEEAEREKEEALVQEKQESESA